MIMKNDVENALKKVIDPETQLNIVDMGLIYEIEIKTPKKVHINMTLTTPGCPMASTLYSNAQSEVEKTFPGIICDIDLVFDPPWKPSMMTKEAQDQLGIDADLYD